MSGPPSPIMFSNIAHLDSQGKESFRGKSILFYWKDQAQLAEEVASMSPNVVLGEIEWKSFPDGFPNLKIKNAGMLKWAHCMFLCSFHSPEIIFDQLCVMFALPLHLPKSLKAVVPFFPTGTMERENSIGEVATAFSLARMLSATPSSARGPTQVCIFDIHALQTQFYFHDSVHARLNTCIGLLLRRLEMLDDPTPISIAFPDDGARKRFGDLFPHFPKIVCSKVREGDERVIRINEGEPSGQHVVIVDDLVQSGGTLLETATRLLQSGAVKVSCYVTHAVFPHESWRKFARESSQIQFEYFWITNTNPVVAQQLQGIAPFEVLSIAPLICDLIEDQIQF
eukprot:TRINITY_DN11423_c0_g1_i2.p1 TRINITY_DN11423_c0_g1~~TRINITY_DN11423_c0_g1_i2.p1  ORF type:complete len:367 (-),score=46.96 TRINITY_DN11423_c0_g1_i2:18-1037(-)